VEVCPARLTDANVIHFLIYTNNMKFNFSERIQSAFGFITPNISKTLNEKGFADVVKSDFGSSFAVYSTNSSDKFDEITLRRDNSKGDEIYKFGYSSILDDYKDIFALPPMLSLNNSKNVIITPINNYDDKYYDVVEKISKGSWDITWRGLLIDMENHEFPLYKLEQLCKIFDFNGVWNVDSEILQALGIQSIFIKDICIDFIEGFEDTIAYSFTMRQIKSIEEQIIN